MKPCISLITLGVDDLERSVKFYAERLGLETEGIIGREFEHGAVAFSSSRLAFGWRFGRVRARPMMPLCRLDRRVPPNLRLPQRCVTRQGNAAMAQTPAAGGPLRIPVQDTFRRGYAGYSRTRACICGGGLESSMASS